MSDLVEQVATAILSETPANYVTQNIAQAYRNAEIALAIIEPVIRADEQENDERIAAWETVARHPTLRPAYEVEGALLPAVLARLTDLGDLERLIMELKPQRRLRRIRRKVTAVIARERGQR